ncbi:mrna capping enzyme [Stylonychia lemnae]|uniref:mRNA 5'-phosphatase n=1 Tax=Stylonychia lemnae TaxID=5949 RepID=A0A078B205_STYLE|nr:mrna capping enzyme [Stylonychia lemnae]|eukprot:CDW88311.1 mrna capping enzyme [Stylonychia lemnae]
MNKFYTDSNPNKQNQVLEIEAKLGEASALTQNMDFLQQHLINIAFNQSFWTILFEQKPDKMQKPLYKFQPGLTEQSSGSLSLNKYVFEQLRQRLSDQAQVQKNLVESYVHTKDESYGYKRDTMRLSFKYNQGTKQYDSNPCEVIRKSRLNDINIKKGQSEKKTFQSDFRISASIEESLPYPIPHGYQKQFTRIKRRHQYRFNWITFDLTHTSSFNDSTGTEGEDNYEVEVEIADINHLRENMKDFELFNRLVWRFLQNIGGLMMQVSDILRNQSQLQQNTFAELVGQYYQKSHLNYSKYYNNAPKSIVGDYLSSVANTMLNNQN